MPDDEGVAYNNDLVKVGNEWRENPALTSGDPDMKGCPICDGPLSRVVDAKWNVAFMCLGACRTLWSPFDLERARA